MTAIITRMFTGRRRMASKPVGALVHAMAEHVLSGGEAIPAWTWLEQSSLSVHALIFPDGQVLLGADERDVAYHAGKSRWQERENLNSCFLGAEFLVAGQHDYSGLLRRIAEPACYSAAQVEAGAVLFAGWARDCGFPPSAIVGHSDVAGDDIRGAGNGKRDPGPGFPWAAFRARVAELLNEAVR